MTCLLGIQGVEESKKKKSFELRLRDRDGYLNTASD